MVDVKFDSAEFAKVIARVDAIVESMEARDVWYDKYERVLMIAPEGNSTIPGDNEGVTSEPNARKLYDPTLQNDAVRIVQMYSVNRPSVDLPIREAKAVDDDADPLAVENEKARKESAAKVVEWLLALLHASNMASQRDVVADACWSALWGEIPIIIDCSLGDYPQGKLPIDVPPYILETTHPRNSYPVYSRRHNLIEHVFKYETTIGALKADYGDAAKFLGGDDTDDAVLIDYMSRTWHWVWEEDHKDTPLLCAQIPEALGRMPRVCRRVSGGPGFVTSGDSPWMSWGKGYIKSGMYGFFNTLYTVLQTVSLNYANQKLVKKMKPGRENEGQNPDWAVQKETLTGYEVGEELAPLTAPLFSPELLTVNNLFSFLRDETLTPRIFGGSAPGGVFAASGLNLLATLSKLATYSIRTGVEDALSQALTNILRWVKARAGTDGVVSVYGTGGLLELSAADLEPLGDDLNVVVKLNPDQQMERMVNLNIAATMKNALRLGRHEWLRVLQQAGLIESEADAEQHMYEEAVLQAEMPKIAKENADLARRMLGVTESIPEAPEALGAGTGMQGVPPGMMTPDMQNPLLAMGQGGVPQPPQPPPDILPEMGQ